MKNDHPMANTLDAQMTRLRRAFKKLIKESGIIGILEKVTIFLEKFLTK